MTMTIEELKALRDLGPEPPRSRRRKFASAFVWLVVIAIPIATAVTVALFALHHLHPVPTGGGG